MKNKLPMNEKTGGAREKFCATISQDRRFGKPETAF
jgi:hypothetical protein